jgi:hypothetical protein
MAEAKKRSHHKRKAVVPVPDGVLAARDKTLAELAGLAGLDEVELEAQVAHQAAVKARMREVALRNLRKATAASKAKVAAGEVPTLAERNAAWRAARGPQPASVWASTKAVVAFTQKLLGDKAYQAALRKRIIAGEAPTIEVLLYQYAYGKPVDRVQVEQRSSVTIIARLSGGDVVVVGKGAGSASHRARVGAIAESAVDDAGGGGALRDGGAGGQDDGGVPSGVAGFAGVSGDGVVPEPGDG